jgi:hypothetical protein
MHFGRLESRLERLDLTLTPLPERVERLDLTVSPLPERVERLDLAIQTLPELVERVALLEESSSIAVRSAARVEEAAARLDQALRESGLAERRAAPPVSVDMLTDGERALCDHVLSHEGYASKAGLWFNPPLSIQHTRDGVRLQDVNERVAEVPFVLRGLATVPAGARVLDVGSRESTLPFALATLGYEVTALDPRGYPLQHPRLAVAMEGMSEHRPAQPYDAVTCVSTIEHLGIGSYALDEAPDADLLAMAAMREALVSGGVLLLTTPFGPAAVDDLERTYDGAGLERLLAGWQVLERSYLRKVDRVTWTWTPDARELEHERGVALVRATPSRT